MNKGNDESKEKTIKEEMEEIVLTIKIGRNGTMAWNVNKPNIPLIFLRSNLQRLVEQLLTDEILGIVDQHYMKKLGLSHKKKGLLV
jgi:hypothetical protein